MLKKISTLIRLGILTCIISLVSFPINAEPYLLFYPSNLVIVEIYQLDVDGTIVDISPSNNRLVYDAEDMHSGKHTIKARARKGLWWSEWRVFIFSSISLTWDKNPLNYDVVEYRIYASKISGQYNTTSPLVSVAVPKTTVTAEARMELEYFVVTVVDDRGLESRFSNEVSRTNGPFHLQVYTEEEE